MYSIYCSIFNTNFNVNLPWRPMETNQKASKCLDQSRALRKPRRLLRSSKVREK